MADMLDIPADTSGEMTHIEIQGDREIFIENHKGIAELSENEVLINAARKNIRLVGSGICVSAMSKSEIRLAGRFEGVSFVD